MSKAQRNRLQPTRVTAKYERRSGVVRLNVPLSVKADTIDMSERTFEGLAATWEEDLGQDVIKKGAFKSSIVEWKASSEALPLLNSHDHYDIFAALGQALSMKETSDGLLIKWEVLEGEDGDRVLARIRPSARTGRAIIGKMSIGFVPTKFSFEQPDGTESYFDRIRIIEEADLMEVSLVLFPMNPGASIDATTVKMWLKTAQDTDPKSLDRITRTELRRLNSKIGLLLKKQKPEDDTLLEDADDTQESPTVQRSSAPARKTADAPDDDADDADDEEELDEEDSELLTKASDDAVETVEETVDPTPRAKAKDPVLATKTEEEGPKPYIFGEALQQRLQKVTLQHKIAPK